MSKRKKLAGFVPGASVPPATRHHWEQKVAWMGWGFFRILLAIFRQQLMYRSWMFSIWTRVKCWAVFLRKFIYTVQIWEKFKLSVIYIQSRNKNHCCKHSKYNLNIYSKINNVQKNTQNTPLRYYHTTWVKKYKFDWLWPI